MIESTSETVSLGELHDLSRDNFMSIHIGISRRVEPGAGPYSGAVLMSGARGVMAFDTVDDALAFIDDIQNHGLITAVRNKIDAPDASRETIIDKLDLQIDDASPDEYIEQTGCEDPFNLDYTIYVERAKIDVSNDQDILVDSYGTMDAKTT